MGRVENMREYLLWLPLIFIFHDMEEVVGFGRFFRNNPELFDQYPVIMNTYRSFTDAGFAAAVYEEFIPFFGISILAYYFPFQFLYSIWFGIFLSLAGHFIIHIFHVIILRKYIPSFITSIICLPVSILIIIRCIRLLSFETVQVLFVLLGVLMMIVNLRIAHAVMHFVNKRNKPV